MPAERAGQGEVGGCTQRAQKAWLLLGFAVERPWLALGQPFLSSFVMNWLRKQPSGLVGPPFLTMTLLSKSARVIIGCVGRAWEQG